MRLQLALLVVTAAAAQAAPQDDLSVLKPGGAPAGKMLYAYLQGEAKKLLDARHEQVTALKTPEAIHARQQALRARFVEALGGFPEKTPLNGRTVGTLQGEGFHVEKVVYESRPGHHVTATLYLPAGKPPFPGVLVPCGHSAEGKAIETYERACLLLVRNGFAVLCYDPIGQGERVQLFNPQGKRAMGLTEEHTVVGVGALLVGQSAATYRIWDGIRSLDYLASRREVDPKRLGCTGNSGGGTLTAYLMALDERIAAAAPSCYLTTLERLFATIGPQDAEQNITGQIAFGMDHADYVEMRAPRPTLMCVATRDFFDIGGAHTTFTEAKRVYEALGAGERVDLFEYNDEHGFSKPRREAAVHWMRRWLLGRDEPVVESDLPTFTEAELRCTATGQVLREFPGEKSVTDLNTARAEELGGERRRAQGRLSPAEWQHQVRRLIALPDTIPAAKAAEGERLVRDGLEIRKILFETEPGIPVPALLFAPAGATGPLPCILYANGAGKAAGAAPGGPIETLARAGNRVLALDLRGMGETGTGKPAYFQTDFKEACLGIHLARPLLGQRVFDLLAVLNWAANQGEMGPFRAVGVGLAAPAVLHAAALEPRIQGVTLDGMVVSWDAVVRAPICHDQLANAVPGALATYDLPDLAASLAPRQLALRSFADPLGKPVAEGAVAAQYAACRAAYERRGAEKALTIGPGI